MKETVIPNNKAILRATRPDIGIIQGFFIGNTILFSVMFISDSIEQQVVASDLQEYRGISIV